MMNKKVALRIIIAVLSFYTIVEVAKAVEQIEANIQPVEFAFFEEEYTIQNS